MLKKIKSLYNRMAYGFEPEAVDRVMYHAEIPADQPGFDKSDAHLGGLGVFFADKKPWCEDLLEWNGNKASELAAYEVAVSNPKPYANRWQIVREAERYATQDDPSGVHGLRTHLEYLGYDGVAYNASPMYSRVPGAVPSHVVVAFRGDQFRRLDKVSHRPLTFVASL